MAPPKFARVTEVWRKKTSSNRSLGWIITVVSVSAFGTLFLFELLVISRPFGEKVPLQIPRLPLQLERPAQSSACRGPRATLHDEAIEADFPPTSNALPDIEYPDPITGSYDAMGLEKSWMTFDQRYGPYGYKEDEEQYEFSKVDWPRVDWGNLADKCVDENRARFGHLNTTLSPFAEPRFRLAGSDDVPPSPRTQTGRQVVLLRAWSTYDYTPEDLWNLRSIVNEASLATGGTYSVVLLVDAKCDDCEAIHRDDEIYRRVLEDSVPAEFRNIAVLFHESLLTSWYPKVGENRPFWQIMQPLQLFAHFYPEFDHYWQFEMDTRFSGHVGKLLEAFHEFGKKQPYKQAAERASWRYIPRVHGSWEEFASNVNRSLDGGATVWGPIKVNKIEPIGLAPPVSDPRQENFTWGVGQDADLLLLTPLNDVRLVEKEVDWIFRNWYTDPTAPRFMSVPAQARASYDLLEAIHHTQHTVGIRAPSEGTLPSFALWHGLKVVGLPLPHFQYPTRDVREMAHVLNGGNPWDFNDGFAHGPGVYRAASLMFFVRPMTFDWASTLPNPLFDRWMGHPPPERDPNAPLPDVREQLIPTELPPFMAEVDGKIYAPNIVVHPRKTNHYTSG